MCLHKAVLGAVLVGLVIKSKQSLDGDLWVLLGVLRQKQAERRPGSRAQEDAGAGEVTVPSSRSGGSKWLHRRPSCRIHGVLASIWAWGGTVT